MIKNKKILHFHPNSTYASIFVSPLMCAETKEGYDTKIISSTDFDLLANWTVPYDFRLKNLFYLPFAFIKIYYILLTFRPDIVVAHNSRSAALPLLASKLTFAQRRIYFNHGVPYIGYSGILLFFLKLLERINCNLSTEVITVSSDMRNLLHVIAPQSKITIIGSGSACGIDLKTFHPRQDGILKFRVEHQIRSDDFVAVYIGRPNKRKGFVECLSLWIENFLRPEYKLVLCGVSRLEVLEFLPFIPSNIICLGFTEEVPQILRESDCLLLPSFHEGFSYAALESMASGCLVIANNIPGIRNLVTNHVSGFLVDGNDPRKYREYIELIRHNPDQFLDMRAKGHQVAQKYSRDIFLDSYLLFLNSTNNISNHLNS